MENKRNILSKSFGSAACLIAAALLAVGVLVEVVTSMIPSIGDALFLQGLMSVLKINYFGKFAFLESIVANKLLWAIVTFIPSIAFAAALFLAWGDSTGKVNGNGIGFTILQYLTWITGVQMIAVCGLAGIMGAITLGTSPILAAFGTIALIGITVALIFYLMKATEAFRSAEYAMMHGTYGSVISPIVVVVPAVYAGIRLLLSILGWLIASDAFKMFGSNPLHVIISASQSVAFCLFAFVIAKARSDSKLHS